MPDQPYDPAARDHTIGERAVQTELSRLEAIRDTAKHELDDAVEAARIASARRENARRLFEQAEAPVRATRQALAILTRRRSMDIAGGGLSAHLDVVPDPVPAGPAGGDLDDLPF